tara:strand:- start:5500 stop:5733 length:234 start_codon:yes stop_codon:yes gene_type:complete
VCSAEGVPDAKIDALAEHETSPLSDRDVDDALFERVLAAFGEAAVIELTAVIAWENASSKFNRALRIGAQGLWRRSD